MSKSKNLVPESKEALSNFKMEAANEVGVNLKKQGYNGNLTLKEAGSVGGQMVNNIFQDKIIIKSLKIYAYHGVFEEEKKLGQIFLLDLTIYVNFKDAIKSDSIENSLNYAKIIKFIEAKFLEKRFNLIESAANFLCDSLMSEFPKIMRVTTKIKKPNAPINSNFSYIAVEITKNKI